jgi:hypothetical protein
MSANQPQNRPTWWNDRTLFTYHAARSNYITTIWNWLMTFLTKLAEPFLFLCILYYGYELLPGVTPPPPSLDATVFTLQQATLDIGGLGLLKTAQQEGLDRRSLPVRVGLTLIGLMIANVVLMMLKKAIPGFDTSIPEAILLIARAVMCVLYGYAIHSLRKEDQGPQAVVKSADVHDRLDQIDDAFGYWVAETQITLAALAQQLAQVARIAAENQSATIEQHQGLLHLGQAMGQQGLDLRADLRGVQDAIPALMRAQSHVIIAEVEGQFRQALTALPVVPSYEEPLQQMQGQIATILEALKPPIEEEEEEPSLETNITLFEAAKVRHQQQESERESELESPPSPRITVKLPDETPPTTKRASKRQTANARGTAQEKARRIIKRNPGIGPAELAKKTGITPQYASRILKQQSS